MPCLPRRRRSAQVLNGSVWIAGESPSYESRLFSLKRQLLQLWLAGQLPEGIDVSPGRCRRRLRSRRCMPSPNVSAAWPGGALDTLLPPLSCAQFVLEQEDAPTARARSPDCPIKGPLLAPAKQVGAAVIPSCVRTHLPEGMACPSHPRRPSPARPAARQRLPQPRAAGS